MSVRNKSTGKYWVPSIPNQRCEQCRVIYTAHSKTQKYCSVECKGQAKSEAARANWLSRTCPGCGVDFRCPPYEPSKFCSRECRFSSGAWKHPVETECSVCDTAFQARWKKYDTGHEAYEKYCSPKCASEGLKTLEDRTCLHCDSVFQAYPKDGQLVCSWKCRKEFYQREKSRPWKGGVVVQGTCSAVLMRREGYAGKYIGQHRLVASQKIGRMLRASEPVLHINGDRFDNREENLFICRSRSESNKYFNGSLPWPKTGNLDTYR